MVDDENESKKKVLELIRKQQEEFRKSVERIVTSPLIQFQVNIHKLLISTIPDFTKLIPKIDWKKLEEIRQRHDNLEKSNFEFKWLGSVSIPFFNHILEIFEKEGVRSAEKFLIENLRDKDNIETLKEWLSEHEAYRQRKQIIDDCLQAHLGTKFTLSIPVLLAQCDGVIIDSVINTLYSKKYVREKKINMRKIAEKCKIKNKHLAKHMIQFYKSYRLGILHGRNKKYFLGYNGEKLSAKAIWTLFEMINLSSKIKRNIQ